MRTLGAHKPGDFTNAELLSLDLDAIIFESLGVANWLTVKVNSKRGTYVPEPPKIPRVWRGAEHDEGPRRQSSTEEVAAFFGKRLKVRYTPKEET